MVWKTLIVVACLALTSCKAIETPKPEPSLPDLGPAEKLEDGILLHTLTLEGGSNPSKLWLYLPEKPAAEKLPCILIAPAGAAPFVGMSLGEGDRPEHLPYVRAGFAVAAYEIDGDLSEDPDDAEIIKAAREFKESEAGLKNARAAIDYLVSKVPSIDSERLYSSGHSSAGTMSLVLAAHEPRIKGCIAFAPACDTRGKMGEEIVEELGAEIPGFSEFITRSSPMNLAADIKCPVFLFHAEDDTVVSIDEVVEFVELLQSTNRAVTFTRVNTGNHYESMIEKGVPAAIQWLRNKTEVSR